jgi:hypothetical protein
MNEPDEFSRFRSATLGWGDWCGAARELQVAGEQSSLVMTKVDDGCVPVARFIQFSNVRTGANIGLRLSLRLRRVLIPVLARPDFVGSLALKVQALGR